MKEVTNFQYFVGEKNEKRDGIWWAEDGFL